jgi:hypothetical protein
VLTTSLGANWGAGSAFKVGEHDGEADSHSRSQACQATPQATPVLWSDDRVPDSLGRPTEPHHAVVEVVDEPIDRHGLVARQGWRAGGHLAGEGRGDVEVVLGAEVILERDNSSDQRRGLGLEGLAGELKRVAQPLARDPELVEGREVGPPDVTSKAHTAW